MLSEENVVFHIFFPKSKPKQVGKCYSSYYYLLYTFQCHVMIKMKSKSHLKVRKKWVRSLSIANSIQSSYRAQFCYRFQNS